jgi:hypothetical protein
MSARRRRTTASPRLRTEWAARSGPVSTALSLGGITSPDRIVILCSRTRESRALYEDMVSFTVGEELEKWVSSLAGSTLLTLRRGGRTPDLRALRYRSRAEEEVRVFAAVSGGTARPAESPRR